VGTAAAATAGVRGAQAGAPVPTRPSRWTKAVCGGRAGRAKAPRWTERQGTGTATRSLSTGVLSWPSDQSIVNNSGYLYRLFYSRTKSASLDNHMYVSGWLLCCH